MPLAEVVQIELARNLDEYFETQKFRFRDNCHIKLLRQLISPIYLRLGPVVAIDVEAYERCTLKVTEIGIAIYDPQDQWLLPIPQIKTIHILTEENLRLRNGKYVADRKFNFNGGVSYSMPQQKVQIFLQQVFAHYFLEKRGILVGHDVGADIKWLTKMGVKMPPYTFTADSLKIYHLTTRKNGSLRMILRRLNIPHANLHNAANDAYYTLLAVLSLCDPQQRIRAELDTYAEIETVEMTKSEKWKAKFSDEVRVLLSSDAPTVADFVS